MVVELLVVIEKEEEQEEKEEEAKGKVSKSEMAEHSCSNCLFCLNMSEYVCLQTYLSVLSKCV